jgi:di/tricarboxylate transporter
VAFFLLVIGLLWGRIKATHLFGGVVLLLLGLGFLPVHHLYDAAINPAILTVMALILLTGIIKKRLNLSLVLPYLGKSPRSFLLRSTLFTALLSGFVNNTPVVALLIPTIKEKAQKHGWNASLFLLPLSFAAVAGGTLTLIGTSTNLVLNGLMLENGIEGFGFWDFLLPGLAVTGSVLLTTIFIAPLILKKDTQEDLQSFATLRQYTTELKVVSGGKMDGKTVQEAGLRNLNDLYLAEIYRDGNFITPVAPTETLKAGDTLFFTGDLERVNLLLDEFPEGLANVEHKFKVDARQDLIEVLVPNNSDLIGRPLKTTNFRARYDAVIIGVQRSGEPLPGKIGRMELQAGDLLLLAAGKDFASKNEQEPTLTPIQQHSRTAANKVGREKYFFPSILILAALGFIFKWTLLFTVGLMILSGIATGLTHAEKLKSEFNIQLYALLILSVAFGTAVVEGAHATYFLEQLNLPESPKVAIVLLFGITLILTNFMTNVTAVAVAFPIAAAMMNHYGLSSLDIFLPLAFGASASFLTPTSYQTHLMVMGAGNYTSRDFLKMGLPVLVVYSVASLWVLL